jgi:uncharacterized Fe-S cluster-containing radical SAM superfamily enzyme
MTDGDFDINLFVKIRPALSEVQTLILSGIGEPLLYPHLERLISEARKSMPVEGIIAFQTNGMLLNSKRAGELRDAGLNRKFITSFT